MASGNLRDRHAASKTSDLTQTLMHGHFAEELGSAGREFANILRDIDAKRWEEEKMQNRSTCAVIKRHVNSFFAATIGRLIEEDIVFLVTLGICTASISFAMDVVINYMITARNMLFMMLNFSVAAQYFAWILYPLVGTCFAVGLTAAFAPTAAGSGVPEIKTSLRGFVLKDYFTLKTLLVKIAGLTAILGVGMPVGKLGPFVHVSCMNSVLLSKLVRRFRRAFQGDVARGMERLAAACAVGAACTFAAPIAGVLFSIEVTTTHFAVKNYLEGFIAAVSAALTFRILAIIFSTEETVTSFFKTNLKQELAFDPRELISYAILGVVMGILAALFVLCHRRYVLFIRTNKTLSALFKRNRFILPVVVTILVTSVSFPAGFGQYSAGILTNTQATNQLFSNFTWVLKEPMNIQQQRILNTWSGPLNSPALSILFFFLMRFWMNITCITLPAAAGVFLPLFSLGASSGRLFGECLALIFPGGIGNAFVVPGSYALIGAAAFSGAATHAVSTAIFVFELTGTIAHILPCLMAVLVANGVMQLFQPSIYDSIIMMKKLPYLPSLSHQRTSYAWQIRVEDFMKPEKELRVVTTESTYRDLVHVLNDNTYRYFPVVDNKETMMLLGLIERSELESLLREQLSPMSRRLFFERKNNAEPESRPRRDSRTVIKRLHDSREKDMDEHETPVKSSFKSIFRRSILKKSTHLATELPNPSNPETPAKVKFDRPITRQFSSEEEDEWVTHQMSQQIDFESGVTIESVPFQLVESTSLYEVHTLFSQLNLHRACVSRMGKLLGMVTLRELKGVLDTKIVPKARLSGEVPFGRWRKSMREKRERRLGNRDENSNDQREQSRPLTSLSTSGGDSKV